MLPFFLACTLSKSIDTSKAIQDTSEEYTEDTETLENDTADNSNEDTASDTETDSETDTEDTSSPIEEGPILFFETEVHVGGTNIWSNLIRIEDDFIFSTVQNEQVAFRRYNRNLEPIDHYYEVTEANDLPPGVVLADHALERKEDHLFFAASVFGD